jgi:hypothetical protein
MSKQNIGETTTKIVNLLTPFESEERKRIVQATLTLLGESLDSAHIKSTKNGESVEIAGDLPQRAKVWMRQNRISIEELEQVYHVDGGKAEIVASNIPGKTKKEQTLNAYLLAGTAGLLAIGEPAFDDKVARELCDTLGFYDPTNHATHMKDKGNKLAGSKAMGWKLTAPGLTQSAALIKEMTKGS